MKNGKNGDCDKKNKLPKKLSKSLINSFLLGEQVFLKTV
jgi:hypothetical protein